LVFASGANEPGEIRGFLSVGIPVGVSASHLDTSSLDEVLRLAGTRIPLFLDNGAVSEVSADPTKQAAAGHVPRPGALLVVKEILPGEWDVRLDFYDVLARALGSQLHAVAPDRVGSQSVTLARLGVHAPRLREVHAAGARVLLPLQRGELSRAAFYREGARLLGFAPVPAFPMHPQKGATLPADVVAFVREVRPPRLHLLGLGLKNRRTASLLRALADVAPELEVSMDSNLLTATVGRAPDGTASRPLTAAYDRIRARGIDTAYAATIDEEWDLHVDYTDCIGSPSTWLPPSARRRVADEAALSPAEARRFLRDPDGFFQEQVHPWDEAGPRRWEDPVLQACLDDAWYGYLERLQTASRKAEAVRDTFAGHPAAGQFPGRPAVGRAA
ncbi:MAG TPA: hypothetical protein VFQ76_10995, partial [Longimicrobiaceae bacterium]|nr:hypothetical protein [Longimicrobiaceae bacterium]